MQDVMCVDMNMYRELFKIDTISHFQKLNQ